MNTRERLLIYRDLRAASPEDAKAFLNANSDDERFVSLVKLGTDFVEEFRKYVEKANSK